MMGLMIEKMRSRYEIRHFPQLAQARESELRCENFGRQCSSKRRNSRIGARVLGFEFVPILEQNFVQTFHRKRLALEASEPDFVGQKQMIPQAVQLIEGHAAPGFALFVRCLRAFEQQFFVHPRIVTRHLGINARGIEKGVGHSHSKGRAPTFRQGFCN